MGPDPRKALQFPRTLPGWKALGSLCNAAKVSGEFLNFGCKVCQSSMLFRNFGENSFLYKFCLVLYLLSAEGALQVN